MTVSAILSALVCVSAVFYCVTYDSARSARRSALRAIRAARKG